MSSSAPQPIRRALISVSDKAGVLDFARALHARGVEIVSTGGTAQHIAQANLPVTDVSQLTGFPEILDGRVKTLHPAVHGGLLAKRGQHAHDAAMQAHGIVAIDLLVVDLYPFEATVAAGADYATCVEQIDIGGPAMLRAAAKNHAYVTVLSDPGDYAVVLAAMDSQGGAVAPDLRRTLAYKAYARTAAYDAAIADWLAPAAEERVPTFHTAGGRLHQNLRYGENPHQQAGLYIGGAPRPGAALARQLQGKALSYNNINDADAAFELVCEFDPTQVAACAIIKHMNPCGVATADTLAQAFAKALRCDPVSAFGGIVALNRPLDAPTATAITQLFVEVIIAPEVNQAARDIVAAKRNLRLLATGELADPCAPGLCIRSVAGGYLVQTRDNGRITPDDLTVVTGRRPSAAQLEDMLFAFRVAKHVKSNAIVYAKAGATVGIGAGQMNRLESARLATHASHSIAPAGGQSASFIA